MVGDKKKFLVRLRKETLAPFNECLKALEEAKYDYDKAKGLLFKKSIKHSSSTSSGDSELPEGKIFQVHTEDYSIAALFCMRAETDFVTNSADFKSTASEIADILLNYLQKGENKTLSLEEFLKLQSTKDELTVEQKISSLSSITKETIKITELIVSPVSEEKCLNLSYVHHNNKLGAILSLKTGEKTDIENIFEIKKLVLHYAASNCLFLTEEEVCPNWLEQEKIN
ncbi:translation elongation factor Ts [Mycoplasma suis]|uniref:Elongation factor Ts n=1 Tax=Mycoplasma suis (strain Illinois) TaxID=768700 RepID=F0QR02_MYCSL|nr:translation elongation factor Ts [Mycoplasma suis]ADX97922.1 translation elongation factor Ts [Mycoplasma suis str. Illinois]